MQVTDAIEQTYAATGFSLIVKAGGRRRIPNPRLDPVVGFSVAGEKTETFGGDEPAIIAKAFDYLAAGNRVAGFALVDTDIKYLFYRSISHDITTPSDLMWLCGRNGKSAPELQNIVDLSRLIGGNAMNAVWRLRKASPEKGVQDAVMARELMAFIDGVDVPGDICADSNECDYQHQSYTTIDTSKLKFKSNDISFFQWIVKPIDGLFANGPLGSGWGRTTKKTISEYPGTVGRCDPLATRICGFAICVNGVTSIGFNHNEGLAIAAGLELLNSTRLTHRIFVENLPEWKYFTAIRGFSSSTFIPEWCFGDAIKKWIFPTSMALSVYDMEFGQTVMRWGIETGAIKNAGMSVELLPPIWTGQDNYEHQIGEYCSLVWHFIGSSMYVPQLGSSPMVATPGLLLV